MTIKVGLIGISGYSSVHFSNLEPLVKKGIVELLGVVVINPEQVPEQLKKLAEMGVKVYPSTDAMYAELSGKLDLVCIPTGIALHSRMTVEYSITEHDPTTTTRKLPIKKTSAVHLDGVLDGFPHLIVIY